MPKASKIAKKPDNKEKSPRPAGQDNGQYNFTEIEPAMLKFWKKNTIHKKANNQNKGKKKYYFLDGPPYTSGKVHIGTAWNKALKDCFLRYQRMKGDVDVWDRAGYDMHGIPTEHATEKKLNIHGKEGIEKFGVSKFIDECKTLCIENMELMNDDFEKLAVWMDLKGAYQSIKDEFIEGEWWLVKKAHENKRLYEGKKTIHWCASCATALAKHELEYKEVTDNSIFVKFKVEATKNEYLVIWTTTPWTLAFNLAVMVNPELDYVKCEVDTDNGKEKWILAKALAGPVVQAVADKTLKIIEEFKGERLEGLKYDHPWLNNIPALKKVKEENDKVHSVVLSKEYVDVTAGSGLVHCAPGCGPEDYEVGHREGLPAFNIIDEQGKFPEEMGAFKGVFAKKDDKKFIQSLEDNGSLIAKTPVEHDYAHCWRCKSPVVFRTTYQWFFKIEDLKENMRELNKEISWMPDWAGNRQFDSWLDNLRDNSITKQRYWGTPLPVWKCDDCGEYDVIGSIKELKEKAGKLPKDLHKPHIDEVSWKCSCGKTKKRIPDILDVWVDAGCASWICLGYPQKEKLFKEMFPADFILEGKDQIRGWFNLLFVASMVSMEKPSFKSVYMHGFVQDAQGRKMSKSLGNYILPEEVISKYGADTLRYYMIGGANPGLDINYNFDDLKLKFRNLSVLWNMHKFLLDMHKQGIKFSKSPKNSDEEKYILSKMNSLTKAATLAFEEKRINEIPGIVEELFLELSRTYIQLVRDKGSIGTKEEKEAVFTTIYTVMMRSLVLLATVAPFISEQIYQNLKSSLKTKEFDCTEESIHLKLWPKADEKMIDVALEKNFEVAKATIQSILGAREKVQLGVRWPVKEVTIILTKKEDKDDQSKAIANSLKSMEELIKIQTNIKEIKIKSSLQGMKQTIKADFAKIGPVFGENSAKVIAQFVITPPDTILKRIEKEGKFVFTTDNNKFEIIKDYLLIEKEIPEHLSEADYRYGELYLNKERTPELEAEGFSREIMRRIQQHRKEAGLSKTDSISLFIQGDKELVDMLLVWKEKIQEKVGASTITISCKEPEKKHKFYKQEKVKAKEFNIFFDKK